MCNEFWCLLGNIYYPLFKRNVTSIAICLFVHIAMIFSPCEYVFVWSRRWQMSNEARGQTKNAAQLGINHPKNWLVQLLSPRPNLLLFEIFVRIWHAPSLLTVQRMGQNIRQPSDAMQPGCWMSKRTKGDEQWAWL